MMEEEIRQDERNQIAEALEKKALQHMRSAECKTMAGSIREYRSSEICREIAQQLRNGQLPT